MVNIPSIEPGNLKQWRIDYDRNTESRLKNMKRGNRDIVVYNTLASGHRLPAAEISSPRDGIPGAIKENYENLCSI